MLTLDSNLSSLKLCNQCKVPVAERFDVTVFRSSNLNI